jgi:hypothetical protein
LALAFFDHGVSPLSARIFSIFAAVKPLTHGSRGALALDARKGRNLDRLDRQELFCGLSEYRDALGIA